MEKRSMGMNNEESTAFRYPSDNAEKSQIIL